MLIYITLLGLLIGSFLNVCIYRIPRHEEIVYTPSHCMKCNTAIKWYDLIPVLSFLILKGRCRNCKTQLSYQYPLIELLNGAAYMGIFLLKGLTVETPFYCIVFSTLLVVTMIDYQYQIIPNGIVVFLLVVGFIHMFVMFFVHQTSPIYYFIGFFAVSVVLLLIAIVSGGKMGGGDIKLMAVCGFLIGWDRIILALMVGSIIGSLIGIAWIVTGFKKRNEPIPFGPFLASGIVVAMLFGELIINWYLSSIL